jgi:hypothetical protein
MATTTSAETSENPRYSMQHSPEHWCQRIVLYILIFIFQRGDSST